MDLTSFQHSFFLSALGNAILNSIWQAFLLWIIYETIIIFYKNTQAKLKYNLSVLMTLLSFIWFAATFISKLLLIEKSSSIVLINSTEDVAEGSVSPFHSILSFMGNMLPYLSVAYIFLLFFLMAKLLSAYRQVHFIATKNLIAPSSSLEIFASKVALQLGISKKIKIWVSNHIEVPATIGFLKPVILIPLASINHLSAYQLEAIILHELSHIKRNDYLINLLISIIETILFFNPFIAIFIKVIRRERENCCDDFVLQYRYDPHSYASALLRLEQNRRSNVQLAMGAVSNKKQLLTRIKRITGTNHEYQFNYGQKLLALLITTGVFCSLAWLSPTKLKREVKTLPLKTNSLKIFQESQLDVISKLPVNESTLSEIVNSKSKKDQRQKKNIQEEPISEKIEVPITSDGNEINSIIDKNSIKNMSSNTKKAFQELNKNNLDPSIFKKIPKDQLVNLGLNITEEINNGLEQAYQEINKVNWVKVQNDINKSLAEIKIDQLPEKQKAAIMEARKYLSITLDKQQFNAPKILKEIQERKLQADSLNAVRNTLLNQRSARFSKQQASNWSFSFNNEINQSKALKRNKPTPVNEEPVLKINGEKLIINIQNKPLPPAEAPHLIKKIRESQRLIVEI
jgi:beta-lactamase regulating signal transducer with metallopeptidase domain